MIYGLSNFKIFTDTLISFSLNNGFKIFNIQNNKTSSPKLPGPYAPLKYIFDFTNHFNF